MKIVVDATAALSGGRVYLSQLLTHLAPLATKHEFIVFHNDDIGPWIAEPAVQSMKFRRVKLPASNEHNWLLIAVLKIGWRLLVLPWHLYALQADLLFSNAGFAPSWRPKRTGLVLALHDPVPFQPAPQAEEKSRLRLLRFVLLHRLLQATLRNCDQVITFSHDLKERVSGQFHFLRNVVVIYHGIEWAEAERASQPNPAELAQFGIRQPYLLYVSQLHRYKNVLRLLEAHALLCRAHPELSLVVVGKPTDAAYRAEIDQTIARLGLNGNVIIIDGCARERLKTFYRAALVMVYPSLAENCPFGMLEAMALGLPLAAARISALPEIGGDAALYFDPYNPVEIASVIEKFVSDELLRATFSEKACARAKLFSWETAARETLRVFEQVLARRQQRGLRMKDKTAPV